jgi:protein-disulfide isomerase
MRSVGNPMRQALLLRLAAPLLVLTASLSGCSSGNGEPQFAEGGAGTVMLPGPPSGERLPEPKTEPQALPGVDTGELVARERRQWWRLVSQLYAPCQEQAVSIAQCVQEERPCAACPAAARMLADRVRSGATVAESEAAYAARFGPNIKRPDIAGSPSRGPEDALVTVVVWSDFQCPACKHAMPVLDEVVEKNAPHIRLVHKFYPLKFHTNAEIAAKAAVAAQNQGRYWEMEKLLFDNQQALSETDLDRYAKALRLDMGRFHADMASEKTAAIIQRDKAEADKAGLSGTPFILINGREFPLGLFRVDTELTPWITLELDLARKSRQAPKPVATPDTAAPPTPTPAAAEPKPIPAARD